MLRGVLRKKIYSDLFDNWNRTVQVVLIIAIGSMAVGSIVGSLEFIQQDITNNWLRNDPASIGLSLGDEGIDENLVDTIRKFPEVDQAEAQLEESIKWRRSPNDPWQPATLRARDDYDEMKLYTLLLQEGEWPRNDVMTANRGYGFTTGDRVYLEINDDVRLVDIGGITWYMNAPPPNFGGNPDFFTTQEHFEAITGKRGFTYLAASVPGAYTEAKAKQAAIKIEDEIEGQDVEVYPGTAENTKIIAPNKHPAQDPIDGVFFILQVMAFAALILGLFLVFNTITAIISQQVPQIGVLKAIGATQGQILILYYTTVVVYGLLAILLSVPVGAIGAHGLREFMVTFIGMNTGPFGVSLQAILIQVAICLISPVVVATVPIFRGAGITVQEAITSYGLTGGGGLVDRLLAQIAFLPRMTSMAVSNTFRNKTRLLMTQLTLVGAGVLFMAVLSARSSIEYTFGPILFQTLQTDILLGFEDEERFEAVETLTRHIEPKTQMVEMWGTASATIRPANQPESFDDRNAIVTGMPLPSQVYNATLRQGRWLSPTDTYALVIHQKEAAKIGVGVGDWVTLDIPLKRETDWQVVGLINDPINDQRIIAPRETLLIEKRSVGQGTELFVTTWTDNSDQNKAVAGNLRQGFDRRGYDLTATEADTLQSLSEDVIAQFNIIVILLLMMAIIIALVGGIALSGVLSINVMERRVEIGILRSIGASNAAISTLFITEGVLLGWLSWLVAVPLSWPFSQILNLAIGLAVNAELIFDFAIYSIGIWFLIITSLGFIASWLPSRGATQVSVRESLSYE